MPSMTQSAAIITAVETQIHNDTGSTAPVDLNRTMASYGYTAATTGAFLVQVASILASLGYPSRCDNPAVLSPVTCASGTVLQTCGLIATVTP